MADRMRWKREYGQLGLTALCAAGLFGLLFGMLNLYPVGDGSILMTDLYSQYVPLLYRFYDVVTGEKGPFADLFLSGGANLYADTACELVNPMNYLLLLFGRERIYLAVNVLFLAYGVLAALSAHFFLLRCWPGRRGWNTALSLCYAFSGYFAYNFQIIRWMIFPVLFPLFALSLLRLSRKGKGGIYALLLAWQLALSIQLGFMTLLFVLFSGGLYALFLERKEERAWRLGRLAWYTLAGILLAGAVLLPSFRILLSSSRAGETLSWLGVMKRHGLDDLFERLFQIAQPALVALLAWGGARAFRGRCRGKRLPADLRFLLALNAFLWLTVLLEPANLLWHLGSYVCFPVRYAYMALLAQVCLAKRLLPDPAAGIEPEEAGAERGESCGKGSAGRSGGSRLRPLPAVLGAAACCAAALWLTLRWQERIVQAFSSLAISSVCPAETGMVCAIMALLMAAGLCALSGGRFQRLLFGLAACCCGLCLNLFIILPESSAVRQENRAAYEEMTRIREEKGEDPLARDGETEAGLPLNAALVSGQGSLSGYIPTSDSGFAKTMEDLGYLVPWVATQDVGGTRISNDLLRTAMVFDLPPEELTLEGETPLERQDGLARLVSGESAVEILDGDELERGENGKYLIRANGARTVWLDAGAPASRIRLSANGTPVEIPESGTAYSPHRLIEIGSFEDEEIVLEAVDSAGNPLPAEGLQIGLADEGRWQETAALQDRGVSVEFSAGEIRVELPDGFAGQTLFLPFAALDGWRCQRNGKAAEVSRILGGFLGAALEDGENLLVFSFRPPWLAAGLVCTLLGAALLACLTAVSRKEGETSGGSAGADGAAQKAVFRLRTAAGRLYQALWLAGLAGIYALPAAGLFCYLAGKLLSIW